VRDNECRKLDPWSPRNARRGNNGKFRALVAAFAAAVLSSAGPVGATTPTPSFIPGTHSAATGSWCAQLAMKWTIVAHGSVGDPQECFVARQQQLLRCFGSVQALETWMRSPVGDPQTCYLAKSSAAAAPG
jgi:hypothetical protein